jgi:hypothetical protein
MTKKECKAWVAKNADAIRAAVSGFAPIVGIIIEHGPNPRIDLVTAPGVNLRQNYSEMMALKTAVKAAVDCPPGMMIVTMDYFPWKMHRFAN